jgi:hypothetical protein
MGWGCSGPSPPRTRLLLPRKPLVPAAVQPPSRHDAPAKPAPDPPLLPRLGRIICVSPFAWQRATLRGGSPRGGPYLPDGGRDDGAVPQSLPGLEDILSLISWLPRATWANRIHERRRVRPSRRAEAM